MESFASGGVLEKCSQKIAPRYHSNRGGALAHTPLMGGLRSYVAGEELVGFVKECLVIDEDLYIMLTWRPQMMSRMPITSHRSYKHCMRMSSPMSQSALCLYI